KFAKENGIAIEDAIAHIKKWTAEKNFQSAENGLSELKKFLGDSEEIQALEKEIFEMKNAQKDGENSTSTGNTKPSIASEQASEDEKSERIMAALSYASYLVIIPLLLKKDSKLCQHHGKQGLILVIIFFLFGIIGNIIYGIGVIFSLLQIAIAIYGGMKAYKGEMWVAPFIGDAAKKLKF
ncbi:DUF4870 domain-containing protein, partial [Candidatus Gracilibacteria bacterium]|nr:DUF4870 domain-containing protein [Candidatus Gracilibacteria bacterium]